jgi:hypothetical protein
LPEVHPFASQQNNKPPHPHMAGLLASATRSTRLRTSRRRRATTSAEPFRSNMSLLNRRLNAAKYHHLLSLPMQHQRRAQWSECPTQTRTATSRPPVPDHLALLVQLPHPHRSDQAVNLKDRPRTTLLSALRPQQQHGHQQVVRLAAQGCLREATHMRSPQLPQLLLPMLKVVSHNPRAKTIPSRRHTLSRSLLVWASRALGNRAPSECSRLRLDQLAGIQRVVTNGQTPLQRLLAV